eukprot:scaffold236921_cov80-Attheya_sp.AAC.1
MAATDAAVAAITGDMHPSGRGRSTRISSPTTTTTSQLPAATDETSIENDTLLPSSTTPSSSPPPPLPTISTARLHPIDDDESSDGLAFSLLNFRSSTS